MDFQTMRQKLSDSLYANFEDFYLDLRSIFENCRVYNDQESLVFRCGQKLERYINQKIRELNAQLWFVVDVIYFLLFVFVSLIW